MFILQETDERIDDLFVNQYDMSVMEVTKFTFNTFADHYNITCAKKATLFSFFISLLHLKLLNFAYGVSFLQIWFVMGKVTPHSI